VLRLGTAGTKIPLDPPPARKLLARVPKRMPACSKFTQSAVSVCACRCRGGGRTPICSDENLRFLLTIKDSARAAHHARRAHLQVSRGAARGSSADVLRKSPAPGLRLLPMFLFLAARWDSGHRTKAFRACRRGCHAVTSASIMVLSSCGNSDRSSRMLCWRGPARPTSSNSARRGRWGEVEALEALAIDPVH